VNSGYTKGDGFGVEIIGSFVLVCIIFFALMPRETLETFTFLYVYSLH